MNDNPIGDALAAANDIVSARIDEQLADVGRGIAELQAENERLRAALAPFAAKATAWEGGHVSVRGRYPARDSVQISHRLGDFRAARAALAGQP